MGTGLAENHDMSDLSRLLDDVYGTGGEPASASASWASETAAVFSGWLPEAAPEVVPDPVEALEAILDLGAAERAADPAPEPEPRPEPAPVPVIVHAPAPASPTRRTWTLRDDDILPAKPSRRLRLRRR